jgi:hypothetical protein
MFCGLHEFASLFYGWSIFDPVSGDSSAGVWRVIGGKTLHIYVNNPNVLGLHSWEANIEVHPIDDGGNEMQVMCSPGSCGSYTGSLLLPMTHYTFTREAGMSSPSGYYVWDINLGEAVNPTADNQNDFQFQVSVSAGGR